MLASTTEEALHIGMTARGRSSCKPVSIEGMVGKLKELAAGGAHRSEAEDEGVMCRSLMIMAVLAQADHPKAVNTALEAILSLTEVLEGDRDEGLAQAYLTQLESLRVCERITDLFLRRAGNEHERPEIDSMLATRCIARLACARMEALSARLSHATREAECLGRACSELLVKGMRSFPQVRDLQLDGTHHLTRDIQQGHALASSDACEAVVAGMSRFPKDEMIQVAGCKFLRLMTNQASLVMAGASKAVLAAFNSSAQKLEPLGCIKHFLAFPIVADQLVGGRLCQLLVTTLKTHPEDKAVQMVALDCIGDMDDYVDKLIDAGATGVVLAALEALPRDLGVCQEAAWAFWTLAGNSTGRRRLYEEGGCPSLVMALDLFPDDAELQSRGCGALANLCQGFPEARRALGEEGACSTALLALLLHRKDPDVQRLGCWAIEELGQDHLNRMTLARSGAGWLILQALQRCFERDEDLQEHALAALAVIAGEGHGTRESLIRQGACSVVLEVLERAPEADASLRQALDDAIASLSLHPVARRQLRSDSRGSRIGLSTRKPRLPTVGLMMAGIWATCCCLVFCGSFLWLLGVGGGRGQPSSTARRVVRRKVE